MKESRDQEQAIKHKLAELLKLKAGRNLLNNSIHDLAAQLAILRLGKDHPGVSFHYPGAGVGGIDVQGYIQNSLEVACEVSTHDKYKGNRRSNIDEDFERLYSSQAKHKYLAVAYGTIEQSLISNQRLQSRYSSIQVIRIL